MKMNLSLLNKMLAIIAAIIALAIVTVTLTTLAVRKGHLTADYRKMDPSPEKISREGKGQTETYTNFRQIRVSLRPDSEDDMENGILVVVPWFSYDRENIQLLEELSQKETKFETLFAEYFSSFSRKELKEKDERQIKEELLQLTNAQLVLGKIRAVYFDKFIFL